VSGNQCQVASDLEWLITGCQVHDGAGGVIADAAVGVAGGRIRLVYGQAADRAKRRLHLPGRIICPGFIDLHCHSDFTALLEPRACNRALAGVTTELCGNCGGSGFPLAEETLRRRRLEFEPMGLRIDFRDMDEYLARCEAVGCAINRAMLVGHGNLRALAAGYENRRLSSIELGRIGQLLENLLRAGVWGLSSGLIYPPSMFGDADELVELARRVARFDGLYSSHVRSEGDGLLEGVGEFLGTISSGGVRGQLSHVKVSGPANWGKLDALKRRLFEAHESGVNFLADRYPYTAGATDLAAGILPAWALEGALERMFERLSDAGRREKVLAHLRDRHQRDGLFERVRITSVANDRFNELVGKNLLQLGEQMNLPAEEAALELVVADKACTGVVIFSMSEANLREILTWPFVVIASDSSIHPADGEGPVRRPHPRAYGTPARFLGTYVRELRLMDWREGIAKLTSQPARQLGLTDRGVIAEGNWADLVVFDPRRIADRATYDDPVRSPAGIEYVFVNGQMVVEEGRQTSALPGKMLLKR